MKRLILVGLLALGLLGRAYADESCGTADTTTGGITIMTAANNKQNVLMCQNLGSVAAVCSTGGTPTTTHGFSLSASGGNLTKSVPANTTVLSGHGQARLPGGAVKCITGSSSAVVCCDSW